MGTILGERFSAMKRRSIKTYRHVSKGYKWVRFVISHLLHANCNKSRIVTWSRAGVLISCTESNFHDGSVEGQNTSSGSMPSMD